MGKMVSHDENPCVYCGRVVISGTGIQLRENDIVWHNQCTGSGLKLGRGRYDSLGRVIRTSERATEFIIRKRTKNGGNVIMAEARTGNQLHGRAVPVKFKTTEEIEARINDFFSQHGGPAVDLKKFLGSGHDILRGDEIPLKWAVPRNNFVNPVSIQQAVDRCLRKQEFHRDMLAIQSQGERMNRNPNAKLHESGKAPSFIIWCPGSHMPVVQTFDTDEALAFTGETS